MFTGVRYPDANSTQMECVEFINARKRAKYSSDLDEIEWLLGLAGGTSALTDFRNARRHIEALLTSGWLDRGWYQDDAPNSGWSSQAITRLQAEKSSDCVIVQFTIAHNVVRSWVFVRPD